MLTETTIMSDLVMNSQIILIGKCYTEYRFDDIFVSASSLWQYKI